MNKHGLIGIKEGAIDSKEIADKIFDGIKDIIKEYSRLEGTLTVLDPAQGICLGVSQYSWLPNSSKQGQTKPRPEREFN